MLEFFSLICKYCIGFIFRMDSLNISEEKLFEYVIWWVGVECFRRNL